MGATTETDQLIAELTRQSVEFSVSGKAMTSPATEGYKRIHHPQMGPLDLEFTSFAVKAAPICRCWFSNPATTESQRKIHGLLAGAGSSPGAR